jgi:hypothetical protein
MAQRTGATATTDSTPFERVLDTRNPAAIQGELTNRLEAARRARIDTDAAALAADRAALESALRDLAGLAPPERLRGLAGLIGLIADQQDEAAAAARAVKDPPAIPHGGWLLLGRVREADGSAPKDGQISFEGAGNAARLLPPIPIPAGGEIRFALPATSVTEIARLSTPAVKIVATVAGRRGEDVAPAPIAANGLHQFDIVLPSGPAPKPQPTPPGR